MSVNTPSSIVVQAEAKRELPRALMGGTSAMRAKGQTYLPQENRESDLGYKTRLARSFLFNGFGKAVKDFTGRVFARDIILNEDVPEVIREYCDNIDLAGQNIDVFARSVFADAMVDGVGYMLADMDPAPQGVITRADAAALNRRPWLVHITAARVLGWKSAAIMGKQTLTQFRYMDDQAEDDGDFGEKTVKQVRVLTRAEGYVVWQTYRQNKEKPGEWAVYAEGTISLPEIPVIPVYVNRTGFFAGEPPLSDLAEVNLAHWQSQSDQKNILHFARVPMLFGAGWSDDAVIEIGAARMMTNPDANARVEVIEHSGAAIGSGRDDLKDLELQMQVLGLELTMPAPGSQSATGAAIDQAKMTTPLAMMAEAMEDALNNALQFMAAFSNLPSGGEVELNKDYTIGFNAAVDATTILAAKGAGLISGATAIRELQRRNILAETIDPDEEVILAMNDGYMDEETLPGDTMPGGAA